MATSRICLIRGHLCFITHLVFKENVGNVSSVLQRVGKKKSIGVTLSKNHYKILTWPARSYDISVNSILLNIHKSQEKLVSRNWKFHIFSKFNLFKRNNSCQKFSNHTWSVFSGKTPAHAISSLSIHPHKSYVESGNWTFHIFF
jgi:hypothetical protein